MMKVEEFGNLPQVLFILRIECMILRREFCQIKGKGASKIRFPQGHTSPPLGPCVGKFGPTAAVLKTPRLGVPKVPAREFEPPSSTELVPAAFHPPLVYQRQICDLENTTTRYITYSTGWLQSRRLNSLTSNFGHLSVPIVGPATYLHSSVGRAVIWNAPPCSTSGTRSRD